MAAWLEARRTEGRFPDLRDRAERILKRMKEMEKAGVVPNPGAAPKEPSFTAAIHPDAALLGGADRRRISPKNGISIGTSSKTNANFAFCSLAQAHAKRVWIACVPTRGSDANADALQNRKIDAGLVDMSTASGVGGPDALHAAYGAGVFLDRAALFVSKDSGISDWRGLDPKRHVLALMGAGAEYFWRDVLRAEPAAAEIPVLYVPSMKESLVKITEDPKYVGLALAPRGSLLTNSYEEAGGGKLRLAPVGWRIGAATDGKGNPIYSKSEALF